MAQEIIEFIHRRFPTDCNWLDGNCYYFAVILRARFGGHIYYNLIQGHFLFELQHRFYDWTGEVTNINLDDLVLWPDYKYIDYLHYNRIVKDVIM